jgi:sec-independent protein translocase protein TatC
MWLLKKLFKKRDEQLAGDGDIVKPFLDHLEDLRWTLVRMISTLAVAMLLAFGFRKQLAASLAYPLKLALGTGSESTLISINPIESVTMSFTLAFYAGIVVSFPILFFFLAEFLLPALTRKEKKYVMPAVGVGFLLFLIGVLLCYFYVLPVTLRWLHSDAAGFGVRPSWTMKEYYGFVTHLCIAVGLVCELPVVMVTLSAIGLISYAWLKGMRVYGYAIALVLAGIISPTPDLFMLFIFALPIMMLFEACIWIVWLLEKRRAKQEEAVEKHPAEQPYVPPPEDEHHGYHDEHQGYDDHGHYHDGHQDDGHYGGHPSPDEPSGPGDKPAAEKPVEEKPAAEQPPADPEKPENPAP